MTPRRAPSRARFAPPRGDAFRTSREARARVARARARDARARADRRFRRRASARVGVDAETSISRASTATAASSHRPRATRARGNTSRALEHRVERARARDRVAVSRCRAARDARASIPSRARASDRPRYIVRAENAPQSGIGIDDRRASRGMAFETRRLRARARRSRRFARTGPDPSRDARGRDSLNSSMFAPLNM
jgi:hypothetical protein